MLTGSEFTERVRDPDRPPFLIAEAADAHYGDLVRAKAMVDAAVRSGADAIKFQHHLPDEEMLPSIPDSSNMREPLYEFLKRNALTIQQHVELAEHCRRAGIPYLCTPFSWAAAEELEREIEPFAYKIGSGELTDIPTLLRIAALGRPMIVSTGMSVETEISRTYDALVDRVPLLVLMNCTSAYPPAQGDVRLGYITRMSTVFERAVIGHSDHTDSIWTSIGAVALGARVIEKHVTIDERLEGPDQSVSIGFEEFGRLAEAIVLVHASRGSERRVLESERSIRRWARRSLVYLRDLPEGAVLDAASVWGKRPGTGIPSARMAEFVGRPLTRPVREGTLLEPADFGLEA